ncbi:MAG: hypothetical protein K5821_00490 [Nitrobacter sp.]|uniref:hypothetical protein n=1 Tax=Nitrobacter sp. TaxID=29420 RepID=UPI00260270AE|nr:hypothetical protein [Nitrobacter sp.]MCV0384902.1 hypothetical protein [Nitrobacter sp.]
MLKRLTTLASAGALALGLFAGLLSPAVAAQGSGCMPTTGTVSGLTFAQDVNAAIAALISSNSGATAPATDCSAAAVKGQIWLDTSTTPNVLKQYDGTSWVSLGAIDAASHLWAPPVGGGAATVTAASTTDICASPVAVQTISGTTTITGFGSACVVGQRKTLIFDNATPLTYNATSLILPGQRDYTTTAGDVADAIYLGSGNWRVVSITKIDGSSVVNPALPLGTVLFGDYGTVPAKTVYGYGQALSRATYPDYFAAVSRVQTGTFTAGNNTITSVANVGGLGAGMPLEGSGIQAGTVVSSVSGTSIVMSKTATANGSLSFTAVVTGYGSGGDSTTVGVKDCRGRVIAGRDDQGGTSATRLTSSVFGSDAFVINGSGGSPTHTLTAAQLPVITPTVASATASHSHLYSGPSVGSVLVASGFDASVQRYGTGQNDATSTTNASVSITMNSFGGGQAHPIIQPTSIAECVVVVLP